MHTDLQTYLPGDLLAKVDITSMAHALECRAPFLDHRVVELAITLPFRHMIAGEGTKPLLTSALPDLVPSALRARKKTGFRIPLDAWFRGELRTLARDSLLSAACRLRGYFRSSAVEDLLDQHQSGAWDHGDRIWALLFLEMWHQRFVDEATATPN